MTKTQKLLNDNGVARWTALVLIALMMFFAYMFVDVLSPLSTLLETSKGWSAETYGTFCSSEYFLNVFAFFLIFAGIILDKMGIRFTGILSGAVMVIGASIKLFAISEWFTPDSGLYQFLSSFWTSFPATAKLASVGFMIFGCGVEMAGVTVSKAIAKWFKGKEMALAMGLEMAIARLGVFAVFRMSPALSTWANRCNPSTVLYNPSCNRSSHLHCIHIHGQETGCTDGCKRRGRGRGAVQGKRYRNTFHQQDIPYCSRPLRTLLFCNLPVPEIRNRYA